MEKKDESDHESRKNWSKLLVTPIISVLCRNPPVSDRREDGGLRLSQLGWCILCWHHEIKTGELAVKFLNLY